MDVRKYEAFQKAVEFGNLSRAADFLCYTQPAVSQMISSMEDEFAVKLLIRSRTGVRLTPEGERLLPHIEEVVARDRVLHNMVDEIRGLDSGTIRIGSITCVSNCWLPRLIGEYQKNYPKIQFEIRQGDYGSVAQWIKAGLVDFGFLNPEAALGLATIPVKKDELLALMPAGHCLAAFERVPLEVLARERFILLGRGFCSEILAAFDARGLKPLIQYRIPDAFTVMAMVEQGLGVSAMADMLLRRQSYALELRPIEPRVERTISVAFRDRDALPIAAKHFIDLVRSMEGLLA